MPTIATTIEHHDLLEALDTHRAFLRATVQGLTDEQAARQPTVSELCLGGLVKHVAAVEARWAEFIVTGPSAVSFSGRDDEIAERWGQFRMAEGETLAAVLAGYEDVAWRTAEIVASTPDLGVSHPLPEAPWFEPGARWSARRTLVHIIAETAQHAGHADILRESIDGAKTMG
jgi:hypothetical protein